MSSSNLGSTNNDSPVDQPAKQASVGIAEVTPITSTVSITSPNGSTVNSISQSLAAVSVSGQSPLKNVHKFVPNTIPSPMPPTVTAAGKSAAKAKSSPPKDKTKAAAPNSICSPSPKRPPTPPGPSGAAPTIAMSSPPPTVILKLAAAPAAHTGSPPSASLKLAATPSSSSVPIALSLSAAPVATSPSPAPMAPNPSPAPVVPSPSPASVAPSSSPTFVAPYSSPAPAASTRLLLPLPLDPLLDSPLPSPISSPATSPIPSPDIAMLLEDLEMTPPLSSMPPPLPKTPYFVQASQLLSSPSPAPYDNPPFVAPRSTTTPAPMTKPTDGPLPTRAAPTSSSNKPPSKKTKLLYVTHNPTIALMGLPALPSPPPSPPMDFELGGSTQDYDPTYNMPLSDSRKKLYVVLDNLPEKIEAKDFDQELVNKQLPMYEEITVIPGVRAVLIYYDPALHAQVIDFRWRWGTPYFPGEGENPCEWGRVMYKASSYKKEDNPRICGQFYSYGAEVLHIRPTRKPDLINIYFKAPIGFDTALNYEENNGCIIVPTTKRGELVITLTRVGIYARNNYSNYIRAHIDNIPSGTLIPKLLAVLRLKAAGAGFKEKDVAALVAHTLYGSNRTGRYGFIFLKSADLARFFFRSPLYTQRGTMHISLAVDDSGEDQSSNQNNNNNNSRGKPNSNGKRGRDDQ